MNIQEIYKQRLTVLNKVEADNKRKYAPISYKDFESLLIVEAEIYQRSIKRPDKFIIDKNNKDAIDSLYCYFVGKEKRGISLTKGICAIGGYGSGKTWTMQAYINLWDQIYRKIFFKAHCKQFPKIFLKHIKENENYFKLRPLFLDELGKDEQVINDFGTKYNPVADTLVMRYDSNSLTLATSNFKQSSLQEIYGETLGDRFKEMFNFIQFSGDSRRK